jgi:hypothetical protein
MAHQKLLLAGLSVVVVLGYAAHTYEQHQEYKTGVYIAKAAFEAQDLLNRQCRNLGDGARQDGCEVSDLHADSVMEHALATASIIPALAASKALQTGFRDGWREARSTASANK